MFRGRKKSPKVEFWLKIDKNIYIFVININKDKFI